MNMSAPAEHFLSVFAGAIPDLRPVEELLPPTFWEQHRATVLPGALLAAGIFGVLLWWLRRARPVVVTPPAALARAALQKLESGPDNSFLAGLVLKTLRQYLPAVIPVLRHRELTVDEIIPQLQRETSLPGELKDEIAALLRQCEQRQFFSGRLDTSVRLAAGALDLISRIEAVRVEPAANCTRQP